jgi:hypothetical protein
MRSPARIVLVVVGLAAAVYGTASLTGQWLGTPPWWTEEASTSAEIFGRQWRIDLVQFRSGREWISGGVVAVGLGLAVVVVDLSDG